MSPAPFKTFLSGTKFEKERQTISSCQVLVRMENLSNKELFASADRPLDKISARLLRICPDLTAESLYVVFNCLISPGIFTDEWKWAKVIPLFKQGERRDVNNYRPISIISVTAKVFERTV